MSLDSEIKQSARQLATDSYDMSVGEIINLYRDGDLIVSPEFQRLFRWTSFQKSHLIESLLIGVPLPSVFVFEIEDGRWELIDGLQRISTILEFVGILIDADGRPYPPSVKVLVETGEPDILRRYRDGKFQGRVGQAAFETIFLGIAQNIDFVESRPNPSKYVMEKTKKLWGRGDVQKFTRAGLRGTDRIKATIPFGIKWFSE